MLNLDRPCPSFTLYQLEGFPKEHVIEELMRRWVLIIDRFTDYMSVKDDSHVDSILTKSLFEKLMVTEETLRYFYYSCAEYMLAIKISLQDPGTVADTKNKISKFFSSLVAHMKNIELLEPNLMVAPTNNFKDKIVTMQRNGLMYFAVDGEERTRQRVVLDAAIRLYDAPANKPLTVEQVVDMQIPTLANATVKRWIPITVNVMEKRRSKYYKLFRDQIFRTMHSYLLRDVNAVYCDPPTVDDYVNEIARELVKASDSVVNDDRLIGKVKRMMEDMEKDLGIVENWCPFAFTTKGIRMFKGYYNSGDYADCRLTSISIEENKKMLDEMVNKSLPIIEEDEDVDAINKEKEERRKKLDKTDKIRTRTKQYREVIHDNLNNAITLVEIRWRHSREIPARVFVLSLFSFLFLSILFTFTFRDISPGTLTSLLPDMLSILILFISQLYIIKFSIQFRFMKNIHVRKVDSHGKKLKDTVLNKELFNTYTVGIVRLIRYLLWSVLHILVIFSIPGILFFWLYPGDLIMKLIEVIVTIAIAELIGLGYFGKFFNYKDEKNGGREYWTIIEESFKLYIVDRLDEIYDRRKVFWREGVSGLDSFYMNFYEDSATVERQIMQEMTREVEEYLRGITLREAGLDELKEQQAKVTEIELRYYAQIKNRKIKEYNKKKTHKSDFDVARIIANYFNFNLSTTFGEKINNHDEVRVRVGNLIEEFKIDVIERLVLTFDKDPVSVIKEIGIVPRKEKTFTILKTIATAISIIYGIFKIFELL